ncbi:hypothetical protein [Duganella qianjiadongensis]|uniref:DUF4893 domain-containing protein n=1 Tax=Duganella qianjiadongensis TaxID=2692176 RepID=A0ABW9VGA0_9BURK|nr:hypothetical protein [Duganella qianjiadongensis]MYM38644.1 hypothetical protein [Duganella qianjiadongensis]
MTSLILTLSLAISNELAQSYQDYFSALPRQVFPPEAIKPAPNFADDHLFWKGSRVSLAGARAFPTEKISPGDLGSHPTFYQSRKLACIEGQPSASSGTAVRHFSVYLIDRPHRKTVIYKLPGMFGSCQNVRKAQNGVILFDDINYRYKPGTDIPYGINFTEYRIEHGRFSATGKIRYARFIEQDNVWKFRIEN